MKIKQKVKRWFIPLLGGAVVVLGIGGPLVTPAYGWCPYAIYSKKCANASSTFTTLSCGIILPPILGYRKKTAGYANTCMSAIFYSGSSPSIGAAFSGLCAYTYKVYDCAGLHTYNKTRSVTLNPCYGTCHG